jgi:hypothetical protein
VVDQPQGWSTEWTINQAQDQPSKRAKVKSASSTIHITTLRHTKPTTLSKCPLSGKRPGVLSLSWLRASS